MNLYPEIAGRKWQQDGLMKWSEFMANGITDFFVNACPAAGKTRITCAALRMAEDAGVFDIAVIVAPSETMRRQWESEAAKYGIDMHYYASDTLANMMHDDHVGYIITTYQQMSMDVPNSVFQHFCETKRVIVGFDEIHHMSEERAWGIAAELAFTNATHRVHLSGTPFRSDSHRIPWLMVPNPDLSEGGDIVRTADAIYTYQEACNDNVCRVMTFVKRDAYIQWEDDDGVWNNRIGEISADDWEHATSEQKAHARRTYNAALDAQETDFPRFLLQESYDHLMRIRREEQSDAGMLVIAPGRDEADQYAEILKVITGNSHIPVIRGDRKDSQSTIKRFKKSKQPVIVAVKMFSEGVDAPRIRVETFLSNEMTDMWFRQIVGRAVRWMENVSSPQWSHMYIPNFAPLVLMARKIEEEIEWIVREQASNTSTSTTPTGQQTTPTFIVHGSTDQHAQGITAQGSDIDQDLVDVGEIATTADPRLKRFGGKEVVSSMVHSLINNPDLMHRFSDVTKPQDDTQDL